MRESMLARPLLPRVHLDPFLLPWYGARWSVQAARLRDLALSDQTRTLLVCSSRSRHRPTPPSPSAEPANRAYFHACERRSSTTQRSFR